MEDDALRVVVDTADFAGRAVMTDELPSVRVSELYAKSAPRDLPVQMLISTPRWLRVWLNLMPFDDFVLGIVWGVRHSSSEPEQLDERRYSVVWRDMPFGGKLAEICCPSCGKPRRIMHVAVEANPGTLFCRVCAHLRYKSQRHPPKPVKRVTKADLRELSRIERRALAAGKGGDWSVQYAHLERAIRARHDIAMRLAAQREEDSRLGEAYLLLRNVLDGH